MNQRRQIHSTFSSQRRVWRSGVALAMAGALVACVTDPDNPIGAASDAAADGHVAAIDAGAKDAGHDATIEDAGPDAADSSVPDATVEASTPDGGHDSGHDAADTSVPDTSVPDTSVPDTSLPDTSVPDTSVPDTSVPDTSVADTSIADTSVPDTSVADANEAGPPDAGPDGAGPPPGGLGPTAYLSFADSPFNGTTLGYFYLEDFEDHLLNTPGVTANGITSSSSTGDPTLIDSVDGDDGDPTDGKCAKPGNCDAWFSGSGDPGITFTFNAATLGALPTHVGVVWTDGGGAITFKAYDASGLLVGTVGPSSDPPNFPDNSFYGTTGEDRFFGIVFMGGVQSISISNSSGGIETDHLQYGR